MQIDSAVLGSESYHGLNYVWLLKLSPGHRLLLGLCLGSSLGPGYASLC